MKQTLCALILLHILSGAVYAADEHTFEELTTCAVYHRMVASEYIMVKKLPLLAEPHQLKTDMLVKAAKKLATESEVNAFWATEVARMEKVIHHQLSRVYLLKDRYYDPCGALTATLN